MRLHGCDQRRNVVRKGRSVIASRVLPDCIVAAQRCRGSRSALHDDNGLLSGSSESDRQRYGGTGTAPRTMWGCRPMPANRSEPKWQVPREEQRRKDSVVEGQEHQGRVLTSYLFTKLSEAKAHQYLPSKKPRAAKPIPRQCPTVFRQEHRRAICQVACKEDGRLSELLCGVGCRA